MKRFKQTKDVLDYARTFHRQLSEYYDSLSKLAEKQRVKMLLDYLSRHEKHLDEILADYEEDASKKVMNTWLKRCLLSTRKILFISLTIVYNEFQRHYEKINLKLLLL